MMLLSKLWSEKPAFIYELLIYITIIIIQNSHIADVSDNLINNSKLL